LKIKRYFGKKANVDTNVYFEEYMASVSKDKNKILAYKPKGLVSRSEAVGSFGLNIEDFEQKLLKENSYVITVRGQTGLFFEKDSVREIRSKKEPAADDMIPEQTLKRFVDISMHCTAQTNIEAVSAIITLSLVCIASLVLL